MAGRCMELIVKTDTCVLLRVGAAVEVVSSWNECVHMQLHHCQRT